MRNTSAAMLSQLSQIPTIGQDRDYGHNQLRHRRHKRLNASRIRVDLDADHPDIVRKVSSEIPHHNRPSTKTLGFELDEVYNQAAHSNVSVSSLDINLAPHFLSGDVQTLAAVERRTRMRRAMRRLSQVGRVRKTEFESKDHLRAHKAGLIHPRSSKKFVFDILVFVSILYLAFVVVCSLLSRNESTNQSQHVLSSHTAVGHLYGH